MMTHFYFGSQASLVKTIDCFGNEFNLQSWNPLCARIDFLLSDTDEIEDAGDFLKTF